jgi:hypothetical protein
MKVTARGYTRAISPEDELAIKCLTCGKILSTKKHTAKFLAPNPNLQVPEGTVISEESVLWDHLVDKHRPRCSV